MDTRRLLSYVRRAVDDYEMIAEGDRICVGISGGKDSLALLAGLANLRYFYPKKFELIALTVDMGFDGVDYTEIEAFCHELNVPYHVKKTEIAQIIFDIRKEKNPCSLCARMRRGILHDMAKEAGCNKLALGHHMDDAAETFMMNLLSGGTAESFRPVTYLSRKDMYVIRPMIFATEKEVSCAARKLKLPVVISRCPNDKESERENVKNLLLTLEKTYPAVKEKIIGALQKGQISGW